MLCMTASYYCKSLSYGNESPLCNVSLFVLYATPVTSDVSYMQDQSLLHKLLSTNLQDGHFDRMRELIEHAVQLNSGRQAVLVAHSMGGLVSLYFITRQSPEWRYVVCHSAFSFAPFHHWLGCLDYKSSAGIVATPYANCDTA